MYMPNGRIYPNAWHYAARERMLVANLVHSNTIPERMFSKSTNKIEVFIEICMSSFDD